MLAVEGFDVSDRTFVCPSCGGTPDRRYNASLNVLSLGRDCLVELRPLPVLRYWQGGARKQEAPSVRAG
ncbi:transposase [Sulfuracidifex tepidarius]|uniref:transposase n=1 Tax=Sulfuracidifex tepidarius TaxID=1294262 RepID=UPI001E4091CF|nr:transposase [Sulfuracidifex tepidarius]